MLFTRLLGRLVRELATVSRVKKNYSRLCFDACEYRPAAAANAIFAGIDALLVVCVPPYIRRPTSVIPCYIRQPAKSVRATTPFECIGNFLKRLNIYTEIPPTPAITDVTVKIMLSVLTLATKNIKQGRFIE